MAERLVCQLLGMFRVELDGRPVNDAAWRRNRAKALVKLLALAPGHRLHREQLSDTLWPDLDGPAAATNFRKALHFARQALAPEHLVLHGPLATLEAPSLWIDVDAFDRAVESADLPAAIALYSGDLLLEDRFEPWTEPRREQLRVRHNQVLLDWARELERRGDLRAAAATLHQLAGADPLHEEAHADLIRVLARTGHRGPALRTYELLAERMRDELGVAPGPPVRRARDEAAAARAVEPPPPHLAEERKLVTVLAAAVTRTGDPEVVRHSVNAGTKLAIDVVRRWGASVEREPSGGLLAVFGAPLAGDDDTASALHAALEVARRLTGSVRVGVETGEVVVETGPRVSGQPVISAARLREAAPPGGVLAGPGAYRLAQGRFAFGDPVGAGEAWPLRASTSGASRRPPTPFVGRTGELAALLSLCEETAAGRRPRLVTVLGVAGAGKSRLVAEAVARAGGGYAVLRGRCLPRGQNGVYGALGEVLRDAVGLTGDRSIEAARLRAGLGELLVPLGLSEEDCRTTVTALALTAGVPLDDDDPLSRLRPTEVAEEIGRAWPRFATAYAGEGPLLLVVEDLHWAGPELLDLLERTAGRSGGPVVLIGTARPELLESRPTYGSRGEGSTLITVSPLTEQDGRSLLAGLRSGWAGGLSDDLAEQVLVRSEGNPFFLEELVAHAVDGAPVESLPYSLQAVLAARLDALPPLERRVLQEASVVGRTFWRQAIESGLGLADVARPLLALEARGLVLARPASTLVGQAEFAFKHALVREVAYASLTRARRARAHAAVGSWLLGLGDRGSGERLDELAELLAYHDREAADPGTAELAWDDPGERAAIRARAVAHLLAAGTVARRRYALPRAIEWHGAALALAAGDDERLRALEALGDDHAEAYHGDRTSEFLGQALAIARADPDRAGDRARLCGKLAWSMAMTPGAYRRSPDAQEAEDLVSEGLAVTPDEPSRARLLMTRAICARLWRGSEPFGQGDRPDPVAVEQRIRAADDAIAIAAALGDEDLVRSGRSTLVVLYGIAGRYAEMLDLAYREVSDLDRWRSRPEQADTIRTFAVLAASIGGRFAESLDCARRALAMARDDHNPHQIMHATYAVLAALFQLGRWDELDGVVAEHLAALADDRALSCQFVRDGPVIAATALARQGERRRAAELAGTVGDPMDDPDSASAWQARYATASGDPATARVISSTKATEGRVYGPQHALALVEAIEAQRDWSALDAVLAAARGEVAGNALLGPFCDRAEGLALAARGRPADAHTCLTRAVAGFTRMGVLFEAARARNAIHPR